MQRMTETAMMLIPYMHPISKEKPMMINLIRYAIYVEEFTMFFSTVMNLLTPLMLKYIDELQLQGYVSNELLG